LKEPWFLVQGFSRIYYRMSVPVPHPVLHISRPQFFINKLLSESGSKLDLVLPNYTEGCERIDDGKFTKGIKHRMFFKRGI